MTGVSPDRAAYEASYRCHGILPGIPFEELDPSDRMELGAVTKAAIEASPELAEARATIDGLRALVAEILAHPGAQQIQPPDVADFVERAGIKPAKAGAE